MFAKKSLFLRQGNEDVVRRRADIANPDFCRLLSAAADAIAVQSDSDTIASDTARAQMILFLGVTMR